MKRYFFFFTQINHKLFVAVRLIASQAEIAMSRIDAVAHLLHYKQQSHAIGSATQRNDVLAAVTTEQSMTLNERSNFIQHIIRVPSGTHLRGDRC